MLVVPQILDVWLCSSFNVSIVYGIQGSRGMVAAQFDALTLHNSRHSQLDNLIDRFIPVYCPALILKAKLSAHGQLGTVTVRFLVLHISGRLHFLRLFIVQTFALSNWLSCLLV